MKFISITGALVATLTAMPASPATTLLNSDSPATGTVASAPDRANRVMILRLQQLDAPGARAVVVRRPAGKGTRDYILVDATTNPADLAKAVATLMFSRRAQGAKISRELRATILPAPATTGSVSKDWKRAARDLARLPRAKVVTVEGVGRGPAVGITTAAIAPRQKAK